MFDINDFDNFVEYNPDQVYGLFDVCSRRFVYIHSNMKFLKFLSVMFSSRYHLWVCDISQADNHQPNMIDNDVAFNWSIEFDQNTHQLFNGDIWYFRHVFKVPRLKELGPPQRSWLIQKDIKYFEYLNTISNILFTSAQSAWDGYVHEIDFEYKESIDTPFVHPRKSFYLKLHNIIYNEYNFDVAKPLIENLINDYAQTL